MKENFYAMPIAWQERYERVRLERPRKQEAPQGENPGKSVFEAGGEDSTQADNTKPLPELETGKKTYATNETLKSSLVSGTDSIGTTESLSRRNQKTPDNWGV